MAYRLIIRRRARREFREILIWYASASPQVGLRLERELAAAFEHVRELPFIGRPHEDGWRTFSLTRFPYTIWYLAFLDDELVVVGHIVHDRRDATAKSG